MPDRIQGEDHTMDVLCRKLERDLEQYDRIWLFDTVTFLPAFCQWKTAAMIEKSLLVLSMEERVNATDRITCRQIPEEEVKQLITLYFTYEFSDRFYLISGRNANYSSLYHLVDRGILTMAEVFEALLV